MLATDECEVCGGEVEEWTQGDIQIYDGYCEFIGTCVDCNATKTLTFTHDSY